MSETELLKFPSTIDLSNLTHFSKNGTTSYSGAQTSNLGQHTNCSLKSFSMSLTNLKTLQILPVDLLTFSTGGIKWDRYLTLEESFGNDEQIPSCVFDGI